MSKGSRRGVVLVTAGVVALAVGAVAVILQVGSSGPASVGAAAESPAGSPITVPSGLPSGGPAALVDPEAGTGIGSSEPANVSEYPGASVPLGMVQFSPDTSPDRQVTTGSGYDYADSDISGFSLTHLSGPGCAIYGDIPILPISGPMPTDPRTRSSLSRIRTNGRSAGNSRSASVRRPRHRGAAHRHHP